MVSVGHISVGLRQGSSDSSHYISVRPSDSQTSHSVCTPRHRPANMSDDEADPELLELLRKSLGMGPNKSDAISSDTKVLRDAEYIYSNSIDVAVDRNGTLSAADLIWDQMQRRSYSTKSWSEHELHPKAKDESTVNFIFTMDLLNFSFWSELKNEDRFSIQYRDKRWTGYWSLVACIQRALDEGRSGITILSLIQLGSYCIPPKMRLTSIRNPNHKSFTLDRRA